LIYLLFSPSLSEGGGDIFTTEGIRNVISNRTNLEEEIKSIHSPEGYKEIIKKFRIYTIKLHLLVKV